MDKIVNPKMVTLARESRGHSQQELADMLKISQGILSKIESGQLRVSYALIEHIATELKYPVSFFYQNFEVYPAGMHLYRKHKTLPAKDLSRITALMNIYRSHVKSLLNAAEIEYEPLPECDVDEYGSASEIARAVREHARIPRGPIANITSILENMGIVIVPFNPGNRMYQGASILAEKPNYIVLVNAHMPGDLFRWTLAHEFGHMVMHRLPTADMENEADEFARELLMPANEIGPYLSDLTLETLASLKKYWKVSMFAILVHAQRLGKITDRHYRTLITRLGSVGITRLKEPAELAVPLEQPTLLNELVEFHSKELGYTPEQMSELLCLEVDEFLEKYRVNNRQLRLIRKTG
jgi:Zn-dependent peptidase ImmA (M78 family)